MKKLQFSLIALGTAALLSGCQNMNTQGLMQSGAQAFQAATLSDSDVKALSEESCAAMDQKNKIAAANSTYTKRLNKIAKALGDTIEGTPVNYKVYETKDVNAWAMANGCVRVYSGLMDMMNDNEVEGVLGHEMGHVALGHSRKRMQVAYATVAARTAIASTGGIAAQLSQTQLADISEQFINAQFSQKQETAADDFSFDLLKKRKIDTTGLATSFDKLADLDKGRESSMFDSHPPSKERADHIRSRIAKEGK
ncbi:metalloprotease LoiP [Enterobacillus tribolii]|uniref:Putative metalloprotease n=1 Tax=Enterobacillus tribolii TaxID=1487935 RepID=A0A370R207_9GAMM|nr:M48 family metallopeptidase [Enterobacillus tribolii]MBW7982946.1 metalloprotease [Enterobacillus tribolii]RDK95951.1 putative metalloprotease [Enterobacillus tribolii]